MPTGYTHKIYDGKEVKFEEFLLSCAKNFGANYRMRDMPLGSPIVEYEADVQFYENRVKEDQEALKKLESRNLEQIQQQLDESHANMIKGYEENVKEKMELKQRYEAILNKVKEWAPPTEDHENLKTFAISQLEASINYDCLIYDKPEKLESKEYIEIKKSSLEQSIKYNQDRIKDEYEKVAAANKWNRDLINSFN